MSRNEQRMMETIENGLRVRGFTPAPDSHRLVPITNSGNFPAILKTGRDMFYENTCTFCGQPVGVFATLINDTLKIYLQQP